MVAWLEDGRLAGYNPATFKLDPLLFHFNQFGSGAVPVDLNGDTRLHYAFPPSIPASTYPNRLAGRMSFSFTAADFTNNNAVSGPNHDGLMGMLMYVNAAWFPAGHQPTANEILAQPASRLGVAKADQYIYGTGPLGWTFNIPGWTPAQLTPNTKYWILAGPFVTTRSGGWRKMAGVDYNVHGRVLSIWTNRPPAKPVITTPDSAPEVGEIVNLTFTLGDPDQHLPTTTRYNRDTIGIEFAYSAIPTADNPNPAKTHLAYKMATDELVNTDITADMPGVFSSDERWSWLNNLTLKVVGGGWTDNPYSNTIPRGTAGLPVGDWMVYVRVADYGHPYPTVPDQPLYKLPGVNRFIDNPAATISPWSDPVRITTTTQVPTPILLAPIDGYAVSEGVPVPMSYRYRSAHTPVLNQIRRVIQMRKTGDPDWITVDSSTTASTTFSMPPSLTNPPAPDPENLFADPGFEVGTNGFTGDPLDARRTVARVVSPDRHSGTAYLRGAFSGSEAYLGPYTIGTAVLDPNWTTINASVWVRCTDPTAFATISIRFLDGSNNPITSDSWDDEGAGFMLAADGAFGPDHWGLLECLTAGSVLVEGTVPNPNIRIPVGAAKAVVEMTVASFGSVNPIAECGWDDLNIVGYEDYPEGSITLEATTEYEWRAQTMDSQYVPSAFSEPERFWVVPAAGSGGVRPFPETTLDGASLGCGTYTACIFRRGGTERVGVLSGVTELDWSRVRDDISTAKVVVADWGIDCGNLLAQLQTWAYELVLFRSNGYSTERVWEGPITLLTYESDKVTIHAKDVMAYAYRRIMRQKMDDHVNGRTVTSRAVQILQNAYAPDDPNVLAYLTPIYNDNDAMQYRSTPAYSRTAFEEVDDMAANAGLDYTAVGRAILVWGTRNRIGTLPEFRDQDLGNSPIVSEYGMNMSNRYSISDGNGIHGEADRLNSDDEDPIYGLVEILSSTWASDTVQDTGTYTSEGIQTMIESFEGYAERSIADRYPPPVVIRVPDNTALNPDTVLSIQQLVPGVVIPLRSTSTLRTVVGSQKLDSVNVVATPGTESIKVTLSPFSRDDAAVEVGEE